jgi:uncharacterized protein with HEPN domain
MYDLSLLKEKLQQINDALSRIEKRSSAVKAPADFMKTDANQDKLDAIAMLLIAIGESFKKIDKETESAFLKKYSEIDWKGVIGVRHVLAHDYFDIDVEEIYKICKQDIPVLRKVISRMLSEMK